MKKIPNSEKLRGGYYTPFGIAQFLAAWGVKSSGDTILEPSCGDGNVALEVALRCRALGARRPRLSAFELIPEEAAVARARLQQHGIPGEGVQSAEFFSVAERLLKGGTKFDLVVGNPPFVRYQDFPEEQRQLSFGLMRQLGLNPSRLANAWLPFLAVSSALVSEKGRLGMVIPAELFQVGYAAELRRFLARVRVLRRPRSVGR